MDSLLEVENFPKRDPDIQQTEAGDCAAHPSRRNHGLQQRAGLARRVQQKIIVAPVAETQRALRRPGQQRQHDANFKAKDNIKDDT